MLRALLAAGAVVALSGCTAPVVGRTGVGVDAAGQPVGYVGVCSDRIDGASLYYQDAGRAPEDREVEVGRWIADSEVTSLASWRMNGAQQGWTATKPLTDLRPDVTYALYGWTLDNSGSTVEVTFTVERLAELEPGEVLFFAGYDETSETDRSHVGAPSDLLSGCTG